MSVQNFTLFSAFLLFALFNHLTNLKAGIRWLKLLTLVLMLTGTLGAAYVLTISLLI